MKLKYIIASLVAGAALLTACEKEADTYLSDIKVDKSIVGFPKEGGSKDIVVTAIADWTVSISEDDAEWLKVSPEKGSAGETTVTITAAAGEDGHDTSIKIISGGQTQIVRVLQEAGEKKETPVTPIADAIKAGAGNFRLQGVVTKVVNTDYGNFYIQDETGSIYIYGVKDAKGYPKDDASGWARFGVEAGDNVVVEGPFKFYGDTPEIVDAEVISVTKSLIDVEAFSFEKLPAIDTTFHLVVKAKESPLLLSSDAEWLQISGVESDGSYILHANENTKTAERTANISIQGPTALKSVAITQKGIEATGSSVSDIIAMEDDSQVQTLPSTVVIALTAKGALLSDGTKAIYAYGDKAAALKIGDGVQVSAKKTTYNGVPELTDITDVAVDSEGNEVNHPEATDITEKAGEYAATEAEYIKLTGTLSVSGNYYNLALDAFEDGSKQGSIVAPVEALNAASYAGKKITVTGYFNGISGGGKYINIITTKIVEFSENPKGSVTNPYTPSEIAALLLGGTTLDENVYIKGKVSAILYTFSASYGTGTFWLSDDGTAYGVSEDKKSTTEPSKDFECYSVYWFGEEKGWAEGGAQLEIGDEVVVCGKTTVYNGVAETSSKKAWVYSVNCATTDANGVGNMSYPFNVAGIESFIDVVEAAKAAAKAADEAEPVFPDVCVGGKISAILYTFSADYGTGTFWISDDGVANGISEDKKSTTAPTKDFECYSVYWNASEQKWTDSDPQPAVGDYVVVKGQYTIYKGTYETSSKKAWVVSHVPAN